MQISNMFGVDINKDVVWRVLSRYCKSKSRNGGPSWLTFIGHAKDSLFDLCCALFLNTQCLPNKKVRVAIIPMVTIVK